MSKRKGGSRLTGRDNECFFCQKKGKHKTFETKYDPIQVCTNCEDLVGVSDDFEDEQN